MQYHKKWLYSINFSLFLLVIIIVGLAVRFFKDPWITIFSISRKDPIPRIYTALMAFQLVACFCGLVGTCTSRVVILKLFWILIISLVLADLVMINPVAGWMSSKHSGFIESVSIVEKPNCTLWQEVSRELECCPDTNIIKKCRNMGYHLSRCLPTSLICTRPLLEWLHYWADNLALLIYFILLPLKCLVVFVLREDIRRIFFIQTVSGDYDDDEDELVPTLRRNRFKEISPLKEVRTAPQRLYGA